MGIAAEDMKTAAKIVVTGDDVEKAKPSPDVFALAAQRLERTS